MTTRAERGRAQHLALHGVDPIGYATLQPGMQYLERSFGYVAYRSVRGVDVALPPVCGARDRAELCRAFIRSRRRPILCYLLDSDVEALDVPMRVAAMGVERMCQPTEVVRCDDRRVLSALRKARRAGVALAPFRMGDPRLEAPLSRIDQAYLARKDVRQELGFLNHPLASAGIDDRRRGFLLQKFDREHQGSFGYVVLNPYGRGGKVNGYLLDIIRFEPTRLWSVYKSVVVLLAQLLEAERIDELCLGYCPLFFPEQKLPAPPRWSCWALSRQIGWLSSQLSSVAYLRGLRANKQALPGRWVTRFLASYSRRADVALGSVLRASGVDPWSRVVPALHWATGRSKTDGASLGASPPAVSRARARGLGES